MTKHKCSELPALIDLNAVEILRYPSIEETTKEWLEGRGVGGLMFTQQHPTGVQPAISPASAPQAGTVAVPEPLLPTRMKLFV